MEKIQRFSKNENRLTEFVQFNPKYLYKHPHILFIYFSYPRIIKDYQSNCLSLYKFQCHQKSSIPTHRMTLSKANFVFNQVKFEIKVYIPKQYDGTLLNSDKRKKKGEKYLPAARFSLLLSGTNEVLEL